MSVQWQTSPEPALFIPSAGPQLGKTAGKAVGDVFGTSGDNVEYGEVNSHVLLGNGERAAWCRQGHSLNPPPRDGGPVAGGSRGQPLLLHPSQVWGKEFFWSCCPQPSCSSALSAERQPGSGHWCLMHGGALRGAGKTQAAAAAAWTSRDVGARQRSEDFSRFRSFSSALKCCR